MKLIRITAKALFFVYYLFRYRSVVIAYNFAFYNFPFAFSKSLARKENYLEFVKTKNRLTLKFAAELKFEYLKMIFAFNDSKVKVISCNDVCAKVLVDGLYLNVRSLSNLITLYELFIETIYDVSYGTVNNVILDIGMNVGYASLYFASLESSSVIYSYEPFTLTFDEALENISSNNRIQHKIVPQNVGLSNYDGEINVPLMESGSGGASTNKDILSVNGTSALPNTQVRIKNILNEIKQISIKHPGQHLYVKVDCEGEEYPIIQALDETGLLNLASGYIIEWHLRGAQPITDILVKNEFKLVSLPKFDLSSGMMYAFKNS